MTTKIALKDGEAELMGDGVVVILQRDEQGSVQSVAVTTDDLKALVRALEG